MALPGGIGMLINALGIKPEVVTEIAEKAPLILAEMQRRVSNIEATLERIEAKLNAKE